MFSVTPSCRWWSFTCTLVWGLGCHEQLGISGPEWDGQRSYLLAVVDDGGAPTRLWAVDVAEGQPVTGPALSVDQDVTLVSLHFSCPLSALGLGPGLIRLTERLTERPTSTVLLPRALGIQALEIDNGAASDWQSLPAPPVAVVEALRRLPIDAASFCATRSPGLATERLPATEGAGAAKFGLPLRAGLFLVGTALDRYVLFERTGERREVTIDVPGPFLAAYEAPDETVWLLAKDGRLVSGRLGGRWRTETSSVPITRRGPSSGLPTSDFGALVGPDTVDAPFELFAATDDQTFVRFDGTQLTDLTFVDRSRQDDGCDTLREPELVWVSPGRVAAGDVANDCRAVTWLDNGTRIVERFLDQRDRVDLLAKRTDGTVLLGSHRGEVWRHTDDRWTRIGITGRQAAVPFITIGESLVVGSSMGSAGTFQWIELTDDNVCPLPPANLPLTLTAWPTAMNEWLLLTIQRTFSFGEPEQALDFTPIRMRLSRLPACTGGQITFQQN